MKARLASFCGIGGKGAIQAFLALDIAVGLLGLGIGMGTGVGTGASPGNFRVVVQAVQAQRPGDESRGGSVIAQDRVHLSAAEFAAALRDGEASFGTWDPERKVFVVERADLRPAPT